MGMARGAPRPRASWNQGTELLGGERWWGSAWDVPCRVAGDAQGPPGPPSHPPPPWGMPALTAPAAFLQWEKQLLLSQIVLVLKIHCTLPPSVLLTE